MKVNVHIERLVLDGLALNRAEAEQMKAGIELELTRLLAAGQLAPHVLSGGRYPTLTLTETLDATGTPERIGEQVAQNLYSGIGEVK